LENSVLDRLAKLRFLQYSVACCITAHVFVIPTKIQQGVYPMTSMSMRLPSNLASRLGELAKATGRTKSFLALQAIQDFVEREAWQVAEITQGLREADGGDFATDEEMADMDAEWSCRAR
jgi:predicted transcriptional regulator